MRTGISIESNDDESEESTSLPIFLGLERHPSNARYVPSIPSVSEMDHGMVVVGALAVMSVMLVLLISVSQNPILHIWVYFLELHIDFMITIWLNILGGPGCIYENPSTQNDNNQSRKSVGSLPNDNRRPRAAYTSAKESDRRISTFSRREEPTLGALFTRCLDGEKGDFLPPLFVWASLRNEFVPGAK